MIVIRISDIPQDELYLLPIVGLRQQIEEDRNRTAPVDGPTEQPMRSTTRPDKLPNTMRRAAGHKAMAGAAFVTDWQLQMEAPQTPAF